MKQRVITAIVALILFIPIVLMGGIWIDVLVCAFAAVGISEIFIMKKQIIVSWDFILALLATLTMARPALESISVRPQPLVSVLTLRRPRVRRRSMQKQVIYFLEHLG